MQGGSTITEQLAKNLLESKSKSKLWQKLQEMILAIRLERRLSKERILELYLDRAYFGSGAFGIRAAEKPYFGKSVSQVSLYEAAMLIGLLRAPSRYNPAHSRVLADERARAVLQSMVDMGFLTEAEFHEAIEEESIRPRQT